MERFLYLITSISMIIIAIWAITPIIIDDITIDSTVARLGLISACIANLFQKKKKIKISEQALEHCPLMEKKMRLRF